MSSVGAFDLIEDHIRTSWLTTPLRFENDPDNDLPEEPEHFVEVYLESTGVVQDTIGAPGANEWLETGRIVLRVMTIRGGGSRQARVYAEALTYLFREQPLGGIYFREFSIAGDDPDGNYYPLVVTVIWDRRDITSTPTP